MKREVKIDTYDRNGVFGLVVECANQAPILMEAEGDQSSYQYAMERSTRALGGRPVRWCVVRLVPVIGNELLLLDMQRLQPKEDEE